MAISATFKQPCPSCETQVPIKDPKLIGKKIACPMCKYPFVVVAPGNADKEEAATQEKSAKAAPAKTTKEAVQQGKPKAKVNGQAAEKEAITAKAPAGAKGAQAKTKPAKPTTEAATEQQGEGAEAGAGGAGPESGGGVDAPAPAKKKASKKLMLGLGLAGVGVAALAVAAFLILGGKKRPDPKKLPTYVDYTQGDNKKSGEKKGGDKKGGDKKGGEKKGGSKKGGEDKGKEKDPPIVIDDGPELPPAGPEFTNLLPNDSEHVLHVPFKNILGHQGLRDAAFNKAVFVDAALRRRLGFSPFAVDDLVRAERFTKSPWVFTVLHTTRAINEKALVQALDLKPEGEPIKRQVYYRVGKSQAWLDQLGQVSFGAPGYLRHIRPRPQRPTFVRLHNKQTLIVADQEPLVAFLEAEGKLKYRTGVNPELKGQVPDKSKGKPDDKTKSDSDSDLPELGLKSLEGNTYMTVSPYLKYMLDVLETLPPRSRDKHLYSVATDLAAARLDTRNTLYQDQLLWSFRQVFDITCLVPQTRARLRLSGTAMHQRGRRDLRFNNLVICKSRGDAIDLYRDLRDRGAPELALLADQLLGHKILLPQSAMRRKEEAKQPFGQPKPDPKPQEEDSVSRMYLGVEKERVMMMLDLVLDVPTALQFVEAAKVVLSSVKGELDMAGSPPARHRLGKAVVQLGKEGLRDRVPLGTFPPGAFPRRMLSNLRSARDPDQRVSWMAALLPFLGHDVLYNRLDFDQSWKGPGNWLVARTLVPEFLDPTYPAASRYVSQPDLPFEVAASHFVGIAGVGLDAAAYPADDPAFDDKRGVLSYDVSRALKEVRENRGLSSSILMIQVPHDSPVGVTPWLAGGGSTLRGVPEKNSIAPFVSTYAGGKRGAYVVMTDGSVRFIDAGISDEAFKTLCTVKGAPPDPKVLDEWAAPMVDEEAEPAPKKVEPKKEPDKDTPKAKIPAGWQDFPVKKGGFAVWMPGKPEEKTQKGTTLFVARRPDKKLVFMAGFSVVDDAELKNPAKLFAQLRSGVSDGTKGKVKEETDISVGPHKGKQYRVEVGGSVSVFRYILAGRRMILINVAYPAGSEPEEVGIFMGSLRVEK
jgi:hypothetical protein